MYTAYCTVQYAEICVRLGNVKTYSWPNSLCAASVAKRLRAIFVWLRCRFGVFSRARIRHTRCDCARALNMATRSSGRSSGLKFTPSSRLGRIGPTKWYTIERLKKMCVSAGRIQLWMSSVFAFDTRGRRIILLCVTRSIGLIYFAMRCVGHGVCCWGRVYLIKLSSKHWNFNLQCVEQVTGMVETLIENEILNHKPK